MYQKLHDLTAPYVMPLDISGMKGRMLRHPTRNKKYDREILFLYGIHGSLERFYGIIHFLSRYGNVTMPDFPGFGGMDPFYKVGRKPSLDSYADYAASFIKLRYRGKKITVVGLSYGFVVITRMLQRYPELRKQVDLVVSVVGIADGGDFAFGRPARYMYEFFFWIARTRPFSWIAQYIILRPWVLKLSYGGNHPKMQALTAEERPAFIDFEAYLWRCNHMRTYGHCMHEFLNLKHPDIVVPETVHHIGTEHDHFLNDARVQDELKKIYGKVVVHRSTLKNHGGTAYDNEEEAREIIPESVLRVLRSK